MEQDAGGSIDVGVGVLGLAVLEQNAGCDLGVLLNQSEDRVGHDFGPGAGEVHQGLEAGVGLAEHAVAVAGDDLAGLQGRPEVVCDVAVGGVVADLVAHVEDPAEDLLGG